MMRTEQEMFDLILKTAMDDERIRAVILNGSRANPNADKDIFQDFDVVYLVTETDSFKDDPGWIACFGEMMMMQRPDEIGDPPPVERHGYAYLMQFMDGNRIDLTLFPINKLDVMEKDSLSVLLVDKDDIFQSFPPPDESSYLPQTPSDMEFNDCCNEFWWVSAYVAKGLWRQEITYAKHMLDRFMRDQLVRMLDWYIGIKTDFNQNPGKFGKYYEKWLPSDRWEILYATYADADLDNNWKALFSMCDLFRWAAVVVGEYFNYEYPCEEDDNVVAHLNYIRDLPQDAQRMYPGV
jgi:aminoglycoside 6-adenylyltransferase